MAKPTRKHTAGLSRQAGRCQAPRPTRPLCCRSWIDSVSSQPEGVWFATACTPADPDTRKHTSRYLDEPCCCPAPLACGTLNQETKNICKARNSPTVSLAAHMAHPLRAQHCTPCFVKLLSHFHRVSHSGLARLIAGLLPHRGHADHAERSGVACLLAELLHLQLDRRAIRGRNRAAGQISGARSDTRQETSPGSKPRGMNHMRLHSATTCSTWDDCSAKISSRGYQVNTQTSCRSQDQSHILQAPSLA